MAVAAHLVGGLFFLFIMGKQVIRINEKNELIIETDSGIIENGSSFVPIKGDFVVDEETARRLALTYKEGFIVKSYVGDLQGFSTSDKVLLSSSKDVNDLMEVLKDLSRSDTKYFTSRLEEFSELEDRYNKAIRFARYAVLWNIVCSVICLCFSIYFLFN